MKKFAFIALLGSLTMAGCATNAPATVANAPVNTTKVSIKNYTYNPPSIMIKAGDTVTWTNNDTVAHTVTSTGFDSGNLDPGQTYRHQFNAPGEYRYGCTYHRDMIGAVTVQ
jgi:plastocyanin